MVLSEAERRRYAEKDNLYAQGRDDHTEWAFGFRGNYGAAPIRYVSHDLSDRERAPLARREMKFSLGRSDFYLTFIRNVSRKKKMRYVHLEEFETPVSLYRVL